MLHRRGVRLAGGEVVGGIIMSKHLQAVKCKDGWLVKIIDTRIVLTEGEVGTLIRQNGLKIRSHNVDGCNETIYAD